MNTEVIEFIRLSSHLSFLLPLVFYIRLFRRFPTQHHMIGILVVAAGTCDALALINGSTMIPNAYLILQFILTTCFFYELIYRKRLEPIALISIGIFVSVLIYSISQRGVFHFYTLAWSFASIVIVVHSIVYVLTVPHLVMDRYFDVNFFSNLIFVVSLSAYSFVALVSFLVFDQVLHHVDTETAKAFWSIHNIFNIVKNLGFAFAFYYTGKRKIYMTVEQLERIAKRLEQESERAV